MNEHFDIEYNQKQFLDGFLRGIKEDNPDIDDDVLNFACNTITNVTRHCKDQVEFTKAILNFIKSYLESLEMISCLSSEQLYKPFYFNKGFSITFDYKYYDNVTIMFKNEDLIIDTLNNINSDHIMTILSIFMGANNLIIKDM